MDPHLELSFSWLNYHLGCLDPDALLIMIMHLLCLSNLNIWFSVMYVLVVNSANLSPNNII